MLKFYWKMQLMQLIIPEDVITVVQAPDDGCQHPKHVELSTDI